MKSFRMLILDRIERSSIRRLLVSLRQKKEIEFRGVTLPMVRKVCPEFATKEFLSVQPMTGSAASVFYLDFKYSYPSDNKHYQQV